MKMRKRSRSDKIPTAQNLENVALFYLSRYAASEFSLRRVLGNRLRRAAMRNPAFAGDDAAQNLLRVSINAIIEKHKKTGALNDMAYAETKIISLRRAGRSARAIRQRLNKSGIKSDIINRTLNEGVEIEDREDAELKAAMILARRRKLGPFRKGDTDFDRKHKEFAILARAGFSPSTIKHVLGKNMADIEDDI